MAKKTLVKKKTLKKATPKKKIAAKKKVSAKKKSGSVPALPKRRITATGILSSRLDSHKSNRLKDNPVPDTLGSRKKK